MVNRTPDHSHLIVHHLKGAPTVGCDKHKKVELIKAVPGLANKLSVVVV